MASIRARERFKRLSLFFLFDLAVFSACSQPLLVAQPDSPVRVCLTQGCFSGDSLKSFPLIIFAEVVRLHDRTVLLVVDNAGMALKNRQGTHIVLKPVRTVIGNPCADKLIISVGLYGRDAIELKVFLKPCRLYGCKTQLADFGLKIFRSGCAVSFGAVVLAVNLVCSTVGLAINPSALGVIKIIKTGEVTAI